MTILLGTTLMGTSPNNTAALQKGESAAAALVQKLGGELKAVMQKDGPIEAISFCSKNAIFLTHDVSKTYGVKMKRVTLQQRNPLNRPTLTESNILSKWVAAVANAQHPVAILANTATGFAYYKPIIINNEVCLKCHGVIDDSTHLGQALKSIYPNDYATGYKMGDLRGMIVVDIPAEN